MRKTATLIITLILALLVLREGAVVHASETPSRYFESLDADTLIASNPAISDLQTALETHPQITTVHLQGKLPDEASLTILMGQHPDILFLWKFDAFGVPTSTTAETLDLSGIPMESTEAIDALMPRFYNLKKVDMCGCGISNEEMDVLNQKYPDTEFVWEVKISGFRLRTDAKFLMPYLYGYKVYNRDLHNLKYCTKLECIDFGHMEISDCSVLENLPNLRYLILADTDISDLSAIGKLSKLEYLEIFLTSATDLWPLTGCVNLSDLNISWTPVQDFSPLLQMSQLDRLWMGGCYTSAPDLRQLSAALPNTSIVFYSHASTNKGWRFCPNYFRQRDILGMFYMYT